MKDVLLKIVDSATADKWADSIQAACDKFDINTPERVAGFVAQCAHESGMFKSVSENLNYKAEALMKLFGRHRISEADCQKYGRIDGVQQADQAGIANTIYGGEYGKKNLGNTEPGDGYAYRGRGLIQLTGRANYKKASDSIGVDLIANPDLVATPEYAAMTAGWFWSANGLNALADAKDILGMTKKVNGGTIGLDHRTELYNKLTA
jgi:putative chitinase